MVADASDGFTTDSWQRYLRHAAYVRANPLFDIEERERKLSIAQRLHGFLQAIQHDEQAVAELDAIFSVLSDPRRPYLLAHPDQNDWLRAWFMADQSSLRRALNAYLDANADGETRFGSFAEAAEEARLVGVAGEQPGAVLTFGSLFNFAVAPQSLPVVRAKPFRQLQAKLGHERISGGSILDHYRSYVSFAGKLSRELRATEITISDMLDVQALIFLSEQDEFWSTQPASYDGVVEPRHSRKGHTALDPGTPYLSVCACLGYELPYLIEWLEFHRLVGVERFFLYNNGDRLAHQQLLAPYIEDGTVVLHDWPVYPPQAPALRRCLEEHREDSRWIAFIDTDEFLFSPMEEALPEVLADYETSPAVAVNWTTFGSSGHRTKPPGLVIENYVMRLNTRRDRLIKHIADPSRVKACVDTHQFVLSEGFVVDENHFPVISPTTTYISDSRLKLNHYHTRSEAEWQVKVSRRRPDNGQFRETVSLDRTASYERHAMRDDAILRYVSALRELVEQAERRHSDLGSISKLRP